jgi:hypothetical protein
MDIKGGNLLIKSAHPHAQDEAPYKMVRSKSGRAYFYRDVKFGAGNIYADGGPGSEGMGGRTCRFELEDGTHYDSIGPWMTNSNDLFAQTGVDLRNRHASRLILARKIEYPKGQYCDRPDMLDVVHYEEEFVEGTFDRANILAQDIADKMGEKLFYFIETSGGAQSFHVLPKERLC